MTERRAARRGWLGTPTFESGRWRGKAKVFGNSIDVILDARDANVRDARLSEALQRVERAIEGVLAKMLELYETSWNDGGDVQRRLRRVTLRAIDADAKGALDLTVSDGGLFAGHTVIARVTKQGAIRVGLAG